MHTTKKKSKEVAGVLETKEGRKQASTKEKAINPEKGSKQRLRCPASKKGIEEAKKCKKTETDRNNTDD